jgi:uncharacterized protein YcfJ
MEVIRTATRIHPVMAAAAASVIIVSLTGAAAITGLLPTSRGAQDSQLNAIPPAAQAYVTPAGYAAPIPAAVPGQMVMPAAAPAQIATAYVQPVPAMAYAQPAPAPKPQVIREVVIKEVVKEKPVHHYHTVTRQVARNDAPTYYQQPAPRPAAQPNYIGIGTGALLGGILGNQVGSGNGRKLATVAGVIGGGMLGNEIANRNR